MKRKFLLPGEYHISERPIIIETLVGSCVSVCLYNRRTGWAAMNHFLQDEPRSEGDCSIGEYGSRATEHINNAFMKTDSNPSHYLAEIFGGAKVIKTNSSDSDIGRKNVAVAEKIPTGRRIRIIRREVGGMRGRRIRFNTATKTIFCRFAGQIGKNATRPQGGLLASAGRAKSDVRCQP